MLTPYNRLDRPRSSYDDVSLVAVLFEWRMRRSEETCCRKSLASPLRAKAERRSDHNFLILETPLIITSTPDCWKNFCRLRNLLLIEINIWNWDYGNWAILWWKNSLDKIAVIHEKTNNLHMALRPIHKNDVKNLGKRWTRRTSGGGEVLTKRRWNHESSNTASFLRPGAVPA